MTTKVLVSGSCGFIFGNFIRKAIYNQNKKESQKYSFVSVDRVTGNKLNSLYWNKNHTFHPADIRDDHIMDIIFEMERPDIVIHGAAESFVDNSLKDPNSFVTSNVLGTQVLLNCAVKHKVKKFIYISTDEVFGQLTNENEDAWTEESPMNPRNPYAASKAAGELMVKAAHYAHGLIYNITRSSNCYGMLQWPEKLIPKTIKCILHKQPIPIYGEGKQIRDWTHVSDNCNAIMTIMEKGEPNQIYNISAHQEFSNMETVQLICNIMERGHDLITFIDDPRGDSHDFRYAVNTQKIEKLGWKPSIKFKDGLPGVIEWYISNQWFLK